MSYWSRARVYIHSIHKVTDQLIAESTVAGTCNKMVVANGIMSPPQSSAVAVTAEPDAVTAGSSTGLQVRSPS